MTLFSPHMLQRSQAKRMKVPEMRRFVQKIVCRHIIDMSKTNFKKIVADWVLSCVSADRL